MKKLTLEQLAIYLPYGLKCRILNYKCDYVGIEKSTINGYYFLKDELHLTYNGGATGKRNGKEIEIFLHHLSNYTDINSDAMNALNVDISTHIEINDVAIKYKSYLSVSHEAVKVMAQNLMDFMWLIDEGLAVDSNKVTK